MAGTFGAHAVLVRFNDAEIALLRVKASTFPLATYMRQKALAS